MLSSQATLYNRTPTPTGRANSRVTQDVTFQQDDNGYRHLTLSIQKPWKISISMGPASLKTHEEQDFNKPLEYTSEKRHTGFTIARFDNLCTQSTPVH